MGLFAIHRLHTFPVTSSRSNGVSGKPPSYTENKNLEVKYMPHSAISLPLADAPSIYKYKPEREL